MARPDYAAQLVDRLAVYDLYARYVHAFDDRDFEALDDIFVPTAMMDWTSAGFIRGEYLKDIRPVYERNAKLFTVDIHLCTNIRIDFDEDMNGATVKSKTLNVSGMPQADGTTKMAQAHGEYTDRIEKIDGIWKIASRYWDNQGSTLGTHLAEGSGGMLGN